MPPTHARHRISFMFVLRESRRIVRPRDIEQVRSHRVDARIVINSSMPMRLRRLTASPKRYARAVQKWKARRT